MTEGAPTQDSGQEYAAQMVAKKFGEYLERMFLTVPETIPIEEQVTQIVASLKERAQDFVDPKDFASLQGKIQNASFKNREEIVKALPSLVSQFLLAHYSLDDLEARMRSSQAEKQGWVEINEVLSYGVKDGTIHLHVPTVFTKKPMEMLKLLESGLKTIAARLKTEPALHEISKITGYSWIVFEYPQLLERMGFVVSKRDETSREALASLNREDFLKRYGS